MSAAHESHEAEAHDAKDAATDHAFDGEPTQVLPPDEPRTPGWVPALGALLFLAAMIGFLVRSGSDAAGASDPAAAAPKPAQPAAAAEPARTAPMPAALQPSRPPPATSGSAMPPMPTPEQIQQIRRAIEERARQQGAAPAAPGSPPPPTPPR